MAISTLKKSSLRVLITGANGLLGGKLVDLLTKEKVSFLATSKGPSRLLDDNIPYQSLDVTDSESIEHCIRDYGPTTIINTAALTQVDQCETDRVRCWELNVESVGHLIKSSRKSNAHLIHLSTDFIFDGNSGPYREEDEANPVNYYGESKLAAENRILDSDITWSIIRTVLVYGATPGLSRSNIMLWVKKSLEEGKEIHVVDDQFRTPTLAEDLAMGCWLVARNRATGTFHISGKDLLTPYDIAQITAKHFSLDKSLIKRTNSKKFKQPALRPLKTGFVIDKARNELGYRPHSFEKGLAITAAQWHR